MKVEKQIVLIVLNNFKNDSRVLKEALSLQANGYNVKVVAIHEAPLPQNESYHGIATHRVNLISRGWSKNKVVQAIKYFEFACRVVAMNRKADIFHCNDLNALPIGVVIKLFFNRNSKIVYDAHEYESDAVPYQSKLQ